MNLGLIGVLGFATVPIAAEQPAPFWPTELEALTPQTSKNQKNDFSQWQQQQRQQLRQSYLWPEPLPQIKAERLSQSDQGTYWREHWQLQLLTPVWQQVWLLIPKTATPAQPKPAILLLHDHGAEFRLGKDKWIRPLDQTKLPLAQQWADKYFSGNFVGEQLAAQGFVVLAADTLGFGDRGPIAYAQQQQLAANFLARGRSLAGFAALEDQQLAAFLAAQPVVKKGQISALGFSMGAYRVWQLAALSEHINAAVGIGWFNQFAKLTVADGNFSKGQSSFYLLHPGVMAQLDLPDIAALAAPKPLLLVMGGKDPLMPTAGVQQGFAKLQQWYRQCSVDAATGLQLKFWPDKGHQFDAQMQQQVWQWLQRQPVAAICDQPTATIKHAKN
ncbi:dienelactone hydrolase family protein [Rheinheimera riviphila]|uniref:dienelactone hydrolase family protein n=1 Tax=Rheinheimera riviphila TaxID=1834037 RepID=UPI0013E35252|nr:alpha/beta hydrolase family protein [Rheinheimera riviphila]